MKTRLLIGLYPGGPLYRAAALAAVFFANPWQADLSAQASDSITVEAFAPEYRRALIVPFDMTYYLSDADHELAQRNDKTLAEVQQTFRYGLDGYVAASVMDLYSAHRMLLDTLPDFNRDLHRLYGAVRYTYRQPFGIRRAAPESPVTPAPEPVDKASGTLRQWVRDKGNALQERATDDQADPYFAEGALRGPVEGRRVMHAELLKPEVLLDFYDRYGTDLFVFVNQMEIRTVYEHCLDRATNTFVRDISLHYSLYDLNGKLFASDVVTVMVSSNTRDLYEVMARAFPALSSAVAEGLPMPRYLRTEAPLELEADDE